MRIRLANATDLADIAACEELAFDLSLTNGKTRDVSPAGVLASQIKDRLIHVILGSARIVGYITFSRGNDHLFVDAIAVLPQHHRKGLGSRLLRFAEMAASGMRLDSVKLFTDGRNAGNLLFYEGHGYRETDRCEEGAFSRVFFSKTLAYRR